MSDQSPFLKLLKGIYIDNTPLYCTGYPDKEFIESYCNQFNIFSKNAKKHILNDKDYSIIEEMGFNAISIWDYRVNQKEPKRFFKNQSLKVDSWGRIIKNGWYTWEGVFQNINVLNSWDFLVLPEEKNLQQLKFFLLNNDLNMDFILSLPGLFEKAWQSIGFINFARSIKKNPNLIIMVIEFFKDYIISLIKLLRKYGASLFIIADDMGYNRRLFINKELYHKFLFEPYKKIIQEIHKHNGRVILHSDGYITPLVPFYIDLGFDALQSIEINAGNNIFELFHEYSGKICYIGNIDNSRYLSFGNPQNLRRYCRRLIKKAKKTKNRLIISPTQQISAIDQPINVFTMIKTIKKMNLS